MKKIALLFAGLSFAGLSFVILVMGCNDDDPVVEYPIQGIWQPLKEVVTTVKTGESPVSDVIVYNECERESRWRFNTETLGVRTEWNDTNISGQCTISSNRNFSYAYNKKDKTIEIKYQGTVEPDKGKIVTLDDKTLNLTIEKISEDSKKYHSVTYTFKRMP